MSLTKNELTEFKLKLVEMRDEIKRQLEGSKSEVTSAADSTASQSQHPGDSATDVAMQTANLALTSVEFALLRQIEHALQRIEEGTYGICEDTGIEIPIKRLMALPLATRTTQAQDKHDKAQKGQY